MTEEDLHQVFDSFGSVLDVSIKESSIDKVSFNIDPSAHSV